MRQRFGNYLRVYMILLYNYDIILTRCINVFREGRYLRFFHVVAIAPEHIKIAGDDKVMTTTSRMGNVSIMANTVTTKGRWPLWS